jgi:hypothetical protein
MKKLLEKWLGFGGPYDDPANHVYRGPDKATEQTPEPQPETIGPLAAKAIECLEAGDFTHRLRFELYYYSHEIGIPIADGGLAKIDIAGEDGEGKAHCLKGSASTDYWVGPSVSLTLGGKTFDLNKTEQAAIKAAFFSTIELAKRRKEEQALSAFLAYTPTKHD